MAVFGLGGPLVGLFLVVGFIFLVSVIDAIHERGKWPIGEFVRGLPSLGALVPATYEWGFIPALACGLLLGLADKRLKTLTKDNLLVCTLIAAIVGASMTSLWVMTRGAEFLWFLTIIGAGSAALLALALEYCRSKINSQSN